VPQAAMGPVQHGPESRLTSAARAGSLTDVERRAESMRGADLGSLATLTGNRFISDVLRFAARPPLDRFARLSAFQTVDYRSTLRFFADVGDGDIEDWLKEYDSATPAIDRASPNPAQIAPWTVDTSQAKILYLLVRKFRPQTLLETGVHYGLSTRALLLGLAHNHAGRLVSTEVNSEVGSLVDDKLRDRWDLKVIRPKPAGIRQVFKEVGPLDLFLHDSKHTYFWQRLEYGLAWPAIRPGGLLLSDDVDSSYAFIDACRGWQVRPTILVGSIRVFGMVRK
jgi:predicted O-methyltransferase YrrM